MRHLHTRILLGSWIVFIALIVMVILFVLSISPRAISDGFLSVGIGNNYQTGDMKKYAKISGHHLDCKKRSSDFGTILCKAKLGGRMLKMELEVSSVYTLGSCSVTYHDMPIECGSTYDVFGTLPHLYMSSDLGLDDEQIDRLRKKNWHVNISETNWIWLAVMFSAIISFFIGCTLWALSSKNNVFKGGVIALISAAIFLFQSYFLCIGLLFLGFID